MFFAALLAGVVLMILPFILMIGFFSALASLGSQSEPMVKPASTLVIDLSVPIMDRAVEDPMAIFTSFSTLAGNVSMPVSLREMTETIAYAAQDENIEGISLTGEGFGGGMAQLVAIRKALDEFKASGKYVTAYANLYSQGDYIVKSLADKVFLNPNGTVDFKGMSMTSMFFKGFEQKYGVGVQVFRTGKFKSAVPAGEDESRESPSEHGADLHHLGYAFDCGGPVARIRPGVGRSGGFAAIGIYRFGGVGMRAGGQLAVCRAVRCVSG